MKAELLQRIRKEFDDGATLKMVIWSFRYPLRAAGIAISIAFTTGGLGSV